MQMDQLHLLLRLAPPVTRQVVQGQLVDDLVELVDQPERVLEVLGRVAVGVVDEGEPDDVFKHFEVAVSEVV